MVAGAQFMNQLVPFHSGQAPVLIAAAGGRARVRFIEKVAQAWQRLADQAKVAGALTNTPRSEPDRGD